MRRLMFVCAAALAAAVPTVAQGQQGAFVGFGAGVGNIRDPGVNQHRTGVMLHARAGWGFGRNAVMLEGGWHGLGDDQASTDDIVFVDPSPQLAFARRPEVLQTMSLLGSVQVGLPGDLYVRPGVGVAWHSFPVYNVDFDAISAGMSEEAGPAAQLAIGRTLRLSPRLPVAVEAIGLWSGGEDSTGARWAAGIQVVPMFRF
ncbi:MAG TPA: hypothetical protein VJT67_10235 [Longimicrobiaceae bacterium]|nr:hypothetical protein [Longimicrobiaceae bacterium]